MLCALRVFLIVYCINWLSSLYLLCRVTELLDYTPEELTGKNIYNLCHGEDADKLRRSHLDRTSFKSFL